MFKGTDTDKQVTKVSQMQREVARKKEQASIATNLTTMSPMSLDSSNPSSRSSTGVPVPSLPKTRKDKLSSKEYCSFRQTTKAKQNV